MVNNPLYTSILSARAEKEINASWSWYEDRQEGLGDRFVQEVLDKINTIEQNPELFSFKHKLYREASLTIFPVVIIYRVNKKKKIANILSIFHTARNYKNKY